MAHTEQVMPGLTLQLQVAERVLLRRLEAPTTDIEVTLLHPGATLACTYPTTTVIERLTLSVELTRDGLPVWVQSGLGPAADAPSVYREAETNYIPGHYVLRVIVRAWFADRTTHDAEYDYEERLGPTQKE